MQILVTGVSGYVGAALVPRLRRDGHAVRGFARSPERVAAAASCSTSSSSATRPPAPGLDEALDGIDVAYYLIHSMEGAAAGAFAERERAGARAFAAAAARGRACGGSSTSAGSCRPTRRSRATSAPASRSRHALLDAVPEAIALRASIVIGARSRSFRFLVRLIERMPVMALPAWRENRTAPIDGRDVLEFLARAATAPADAGRAVVGHRRPGRDDLRGHDLPIADSLMVAAALAVARMSRSRRSRPSSPRRSRARTPR